MRQAGRYLPEYLEVRSKFKDFMEFCLTPEAVTKVTLQPIERFGFDAAIIFCDILIVPHLLGQNVKFVAGEGPVLSPVDWDIFIKNASNTPHHYEGFQEKLSPVLTAITETRKALPQDKALFGFCGSPWTVACYMLHGGKISGSDVNILSQTQNRDLMPKIINILKGYLANLLIAQIDAGCDVVQIFDSWAGLTPEDKMEEYLWQPLTWVVNQVRLRHPSVPIVYFGRGVNQHYPEIMKRIPGISFGLDQGTDIVWAKNNVQVSAPVQGNLDPLLLVNGNFQNRVREIINNFAGGPFVFNLGHGILPTTPLDHVYKLVEIVKG